MRATRWKIVERGTNKEIATFYDVTNRMPANDVVAAWAMLHNRIASKYMAVHSSHH